ncbi:MAG: tRNA lysidine(34) synthetase TilS [Lachnospiraceae bacterium]|nr:tRNA lysidine(34) synthetase TilS [Lachnospiraceae bacterium]
MGEVIKLNGESMVTKVEQYTKKWNMMEKGDRIVVGLSGGADSVALLLVLQSLKKIYALELFTVHINHGIRMEASKDAEYARKLSDELEIPFYLFEADIPAMAKEQGVSEEEMGRIYRYRCFDDVMNQVGAKKLAIAHHMDDQAETVLFHLVRGSRMAGLEGIHPVTELWNRQGENDVSTKKCLSDKQEKKIIRPLLNCRKEELLHWLQENNVMWMEDCTNEDNTYSRNCIRNQVLPVLEQVNAQAVRHIAEYADEMREYKTFFQHAVDNCIAKEVVMTAEGVCETNRNRLMQQEEILAKAVLYEMMAKVCGKKKDIGSVHVQAVYDLLDNQSGKKIMLPYAMIAEISYEKLKIRKSLEKVEALSACGIHIDWLQMMQNEEREHCFSLSDYGKLKVHLYMKNQCTEQQWNTLVNEASNSKNNYTKFFECDRMKFALRVRVGEPEDSFVMNAKGDRKKLSRYYIDEKVPTEQRNKILVLAEGSDVLWIIGRRRCEEYKVSEHSKMILKIMYEGE